MLSLYRRNKDELKKREEELKKRQGDLEKREEDLKKRDEELEETLLSGLAEIKKFREAAARYQRKVAFVNRRYCKMKAELEKATGENERLKAEVTAKGAKLKQAEGFKCGICLDNIKDCVTKCGHGFCKDCIGQYFQSAEDIIQRIGAAPCPLCRTALEPTQVWTVYLGGEEARRNRSVGGSEDEAEEHEAEGEAEADESGVGSSRPSHGADVVVIDD